MYATRAFKFYNKVLPCLNDTNKVNTCSILIIAEEGAQNTDTTTREFASSMSKN